MNPSVSQWLLQGSSRDLVNTDELARLAGTKSIIQDDRRRRTRWFDGRFLAAKDQIREQDYMLTRFADLGRAGGVGVVSGLMVSHSGSATISIEAGQGITPSGEQVLIPQSTAIDLTQIEKIELIDASFGLSRLPRDPDINRSGIFILGLRPVEYTGNPIASYPTTINGPRGVQDGDIIEASAIVLVPYHDEGALSETLQRRSRVARRIFVENGAAGAPENVLPLAMIAMDRGVIQWVDQFLVRREVGMEHGSILGLGFSPRALREAHILQYLSQLSEVMQGRNAASQGQNFAAHDYFEVLPPAGMMPAAAIHSEDFSQTYFPPEVQCDLSILPQDELLALIEESLLLPPLNLTATPEELESTSVLIIAPIPRGEIPGFKATLNTLLNPVRSTAPGLVFRRKPVESLFALTALRLQPPPVNVESPIDAAWKRVVNRSPLLWYVRRRNLQIREDVTGLHPPADSVGRIWSTVDAVIALGLASRLATLRQKATPDGFVEISTLLSAPAMLDFSAAGSPISKTLMQGALQELEQVKTLDRPGIAPVALRFSNPRLGQGLARIQKTAPDFAGDPVIQVIGKSAAVPELDLLGQSLSDANLTAFAGPVLTAAKSGAADAPAKVASLVNQAITAGHLELPQ